MTHFARHGRPLFLAALLIAGCGSVVTFSRVSREQGVADYDSGKFAEAEGAFADAIRQNPRDYVSHAYLGRLYDAKKQYANALAHFKTSLEVQPLTDAGKANSAFRVRTLTAQADTLAKVNDGDKSVNALDAAATGSKTGEEYYQLARLHAGRGDADSALAAYDQAAAQAPGQFYIAKAQAQYQLRQGLKAAAEQSFRRAYRLNDADAEVNTALRGLGVIPGPSLKDEGALKKPLLPGGPLPDLLNRDRQPTPPGGGIPADVRE